MVRTDKHDRGTGSFLNILIDWKLRRKIAGWEIGGAEKHLHWRIR